MTNIIIRKLNNESNENLRKKHQFLPQYRDLFAAVFRIPDKGLQNRILQAVNDTTTCIFCRKNKVEFCDMTTQTDNVETIAIDNTKYGNTPFEKVQVEEREMKRKGRKRKRTKKGPEVVKREDIQEAPKANFCSQVNKPVRCTSRSSSTCSFLSFIDADNLLDRIIPLTPKSEVILKMKEEYEKCLKYNSDGYLPLHLAILNEDELYMQRQLVVLKYKKINLNSIFTKFDKFEDQNLIQLSIQNNSNINIFKKLIQEGMSLSENNSEENTVIHLAAKFINNTDTFKFLLETCKNIDFLRKQNVEGCTPLHIAVARNRYDIARTILDFIDSFLGLKGIEYPELTDLNCNKANLIFLRNNLNHITIDAQYNKIKSTIIDSKEMKCGRTALFTAIELKNDHIVYLLLNHLASPTIKDYNVMTAQTFHAAEKGSTNKDLDDAFNKVILSLKKI